MRQSYAFSLILLILLTTAFFFFVPSIDIKISHYFFQHGKFPLATQYWANISRHILYILIYALAAFALLQIAFNLLSKNRLQLLSNKACLYVLTCILVGPVLLTNVLLKNHWGRPRPRQIQVFNGNKTYEPVFVISNQCTTNCSFVCGDTAGAICLLALAFVLRQKRKLLITAILLYSALIGFIRIAQGGHFLSDVLLSYELNLLCLAALYRLYYPQKMTQTNLEKSQLQPKARL